MMSVVAIKSDAIVRRQESEYLQSLAQRLRMWRLREGKSYFSMPTSLWDEAVAVARKMGLTPTARTLGLNREELKRRMGLPVSAETLSASAAAAAQEQAEFLEMPGLAQALLGSAPEPAVRTVAARDADEGSDEPPPPATSSSGEALIELSAADGTRLSMRMPVASFDVSAWIHSFRSRA